MNKILLLFLLLLPATVFSDELDNIIRHTMNNSLSGQDLTNQYRLTYLGRRGNWLNLMPSLSISGGYGYDNSDTDPADGWSGSISFSESFSDVDATIQTIRKGENTFSAALLRQEVSKRDLIDSVIQNYTALAALRLAQDISVTNLENKIISYRIMRVKINSGQEIALNLEKLSNEILADRAELEVSAMEYTNKLREFQLLTSIPAEEIQVETGFPTEGIVPLEKSQYDLKMEALRYDMKNNQIDLSRQKRKHFLPTLGLSLYCSYDIDDNDTSYGASASASFSFLDFFSRQQDIEETRIKTHQLRTSLSNLQLEYHNTLELLDKKSKMLKKKIALLENEVRLERELQKLYRYQYETDKIDYYEYRTRQTQLLSVELRLVQSRSELYILMKRRQYGILKN